MGLEWPLRLNVDPEGQSSRKWECEDYRVTISGFLILICSTLDTLHAGYFANCRNPPFFLPNTISLHEDCSTTTRVDDLLVMLGLFGSSLFPTLPSSIISAIISWIPDLNNLRIMTCLLTVLHSVCPVYNPLLCLDHLTFTVNCFSLNSLITHFQISKNFLFRSRTLARKWNDLALQFAS